MKRRTVLAAATSSTFLGLAAHAQPADWPTRPVRWIVPWAPGGGGDIVARAVAQKLSERWGQMVSADNRPGGNTVIGAMEGARAAPDGHTLFQPISSTLTINPFTLSKLPYDPIRDFTPIAILSYVPLMIASSKSSQIRTLADAIAAAKKAPDTVTIGSASPTQLHVEQWSRDWGVKLRYVSYKSGIDITKGLLGGEIQLGVDAIPNNQPHVLAGSMYGLAINSGRRMPSMPQVPTLDELRMPHSEPVIWHALDAPAGLPPALLRRISADVQSVLAMSDVRDKLSALGLEPVQVGPQEFSATIKSEMAKVQPLVKELGIRWD